MPYHLITVCRVRQAGISSDEGKPIIDSLNSLREYKGCTEIDGQLEIRIRGGGGKYTQKYQNKIKYIFLVMALPLLGNKAQ